MRRRQRSSGGRELEAAVRLWRAERRQQRGYGVLEGGEEAVSRRDAPFEKTQFSAVNAPRARTT